MNKCPLHDLLNPSVYADGMPHALLAAMRADHGPVVKLHDATLGYDYWAVLGHAELDQVSKNPALFSSAAQGPWPNFMCALTQNCRPPSKVQAPCITSPSTFTPLTMKRGRKG